MNYKLTMLSATLALLIIIVVAPTNWTQAQQGPSTTGGDALWHLPKFGEKPKLDDTLPRVML